MTTDAPEAALADLLAHAGWLSELAQKLAREDIAADAVQQTWLAVLRTPPAPGRPPRPWLARVLVNFVRQRARAEGRRGRHEGDVATALPEPPAEAADLLYERMALHRALAAQVMELPELYRRVVLLRYYEGRSAEEIARALGVPAGTVRWRLKEGLDRLRATLDRDRGTWRVLVAPIATGGIVVAKLNVLALAAVLLLGLGGGAVVWRLAWPPGAGVAGAAANPHGTAALRPTGERGGRAGSSPGDGTPPNRPVPALAPPRLVVPPVASDERAAPPDGQRPASTGHIPKEDLRAAVRTAIPAVKQCFADLLLKDPRAGGRLVVHFVIEERDGAGHIAEATVVPQERDGGTREFVAPLTEQCILTALAATPYPAPVGGPVTVDYPFELSPN